LAWIAVDGLFAAELLRFGRAFLVQEGRERNVEEHLQKLRFPVLHRRFDEMGRRQVFGHAHFGAAVVPLV
jgi:hypothetical protein